MAAVVVAVVVYGYGSVVVYGHGLVVVYGYGFGAVVVDGRGDDDGAKRQKIRTARGYAGCSFIMRGEIVLNGSSTI